MYDTKTALRAAKVEMNKIAKQIDLNALFTEDAENDNLCIIFDNLRESILSNIRFMANKPAHYYWTKEGEKYAALAELAKELDNAILNKLGEENVRNIQLAAHYGEVLLAEEEAEEAEWNELCAEAEALGLVRNEDYFGEGDDLFIEPEAEEEEEAEAAEEAVEIEASEEAAAEAETEAETEEAHAESESEEETETAETEDEIFLIKKQTPWLAAAAEKKEMLDERWTTRRGRKAEGHAEGADEARLLPMHGGSPRSSESESGSRGNHAGKSHPAVPRRVRLWMRKRRTLLVAKLPPCAQLRL